MTHITTETLENVISISALEFTPAEKERVAADIENILDYIDQMNELDTDGVEPTYQVTDLQNVWREDAVDETLLARDEVLKSAGENVTQSQVKVPKVL